MVPPEVRLSAGAAEGERFPRGCVANRFIQISVSFRLRAKAEAYDTPLKSGLAETLRCVNNQREQIGNGLPFGHFFLLLSRL